MTAPLEAIAARVLDRHRWKSMGVSSVQCECGEILYGDDSLTQFPADEAFRTHVAAELAAAIRADEGLVEAMARNLWDWLYDDGGYATVNEADMPDIARAALDAITGGAS